MMKLAKIADRDCELPQGWGDIDIRGLTADSRAVEPGYLFAAILGEANDGGSFIPEALARGAAALLASPDVTIEGTGLPILRDRNVRRGLALMAARFHPRQPDTVVAVTGTNGKTSVSLLAAELLTQLDRPCGVLGTLGYGVYGSELEAPPHTTPDAVQVQQWLAHFRDCNVRHVSMEASSHALDQSRLNGVHISTAAFTNLTRDHLDYHGSMAAYGAAKRRLFDLPGLKCAVINLDDDFGRELAATLADSVERIGCTLSGKRAPRGRTLQAGNLHPHSGGIRFEVSGDFGSGRVDSRLLGKFNVQNLLIVLGMLLSLEIPFDDALATLGQARTVPGRMECFGGDTRYPLVVVDYAHTPDALENSLNAARTHCHGQLWCVFGCGGERDRGKRPEMGAIAERLADRVVVTDDNPRHEDGDAIVSEILAGMHKPRQALVERERMRAITAAVHSAGPGDVVLVAGKGHEIDQTVGDQRIPYSDRETVQRLLSEVHA